MSESGSNSVPGAKSQTDGHEALTDDAESSEFGIVGIGASAGGLEAFTQLLEATPADTGMAFILVQHLAPAHPSALAEILSRATQMAVTEVHDRTVVEPNHVYVIPPAQNMIIAGRELHLRPREEDERVHHPIDLFFRSLADDLGHRAIGVVLSGNATDGTSGLEAIKAAGGLTFAQDDSAPFPGMPRSAIDIGSVDFVLPPDGIARELARVAVHTNSGSIGEVTSQGNPKGLSRVIQLIHQATGVDFAHYKLNTLYRRISRRMILRKIDGIDAYIQLLEEKPEEVEALSRDILINVTSFFRDQTAFDLLKNEVFPRMIKDRPMHDPVRIWTIGCSTGQEAYSIAICFAEAVEATRSQVALQLFATDLNASNIDTARAGIYSKDIEQDVSAERLHRYFTEVDGKYRIHKAIRDSCIFSRHNVVADPPFSRLDIVSCRNLLIYLDPVLQQRTMSTLHYALKPDGVLWLGSSETSGVHRSLFEIADSKHKMYTRKMGSGQRAGHFPLHFGSSPRTPFVAVETRATTGVGELAREADRILAAKLAPPGVLVSADLDILQFRGDMGGFLSPSPGRASLNLLKMLRPGLDVAVIDALQSASVDHRPVRTSGLQVRSADGYRDVSIEVIPVRGSDSGEDGFLVLFDGASPGDLAPSDSENPQAIVSNAESDRLVQELDSTRAYLQSVIERQEAANEELQSASEEVQSANEELQSVNEELETSKEEIQSSNEELATVNEELDHRIVELHGLNDDLLNLFSSVQMAMVIVGFDLKIRRFTPTAEKLLHLMPADIGRPLADIRFDFDGLGDIVPLLSDVIETGSNREMDVRDRAGHWYSLRIRPYRTVENEVEGAVVMLVDVDALKRENEYIESIVSTVHEPLVVLDQDLRVRSASRAFYKTFRVSPEDTEGRLIYELGYREWDIPELRARLEDILLIDTHFDDFEVDCEVEGLGRRTMMLNARRLLQGSERRPAILLAIVDVSERKRTDNALSASELRYRRLFESAKDGILILDAATAAISDANPFLVELLGCGREDLIGKELWEIGLFADIKASKLAVRALQEHQYLRYDDLPLETADGRRIEVEMVSSVYGEADHRVIQCNIRDITVRKHQQDVEREGERRLRFVMDSMPQKVVTARPDGSVDYFNPQWSAFTGNSFDEVRGWDWTAFIHPEDLGETVRLWRQSIESGVAFLLEHRFLRSDGTYRWHLSQILPLRDQGGSIVMWIGSSTDVHLQKQSANRLQLLAANLSVTDQRKNEFLAMLAHELRNPLAPIVTALKVLRLTEWDGEAVRSASEMLERQVGQLVRLVDDLLDVSRISRGKIELRLGRVEMQSIIHQAIEAARPLLDARNHEFAVELPTQPLYLNADATRLAQVVGNLLNNACKFTDRGGSISVSVALQGDQAVVRIKDNGIGIASDQVDNIFEMFVQGDTSLERATSGLGIGLTLVRRLVELHHGTIEAFSGGVGKGSEFVVRLPIEVASDDPPVLISEPELAVPTTGHRILVVDDNTDSSESMSMLLKLLGNETFTASDGLEALEAAETIRPDVVLLDIGLPTLNGYEVCRSIRAQPWGKSMILIALTGWGQGEDRSRSTAAGFNAHMVKPVDFDELSELLSRLLSGGQGPAGE